jgi:hypothetical protein
MSNITLYEKNKMDQDNPNVLLDVIDATATNDGTDFLFKLKDRSNDTGWATTGSNDAALTQIDIDLGDPYNINRIMLLNHNLKAYTLKYWNGAAYVDFSTPIAETVYAQDASFHSFDLVSARLFRFIVQGTQIANADKTLSQLIFTRQVGVFTAQPNVSRAESNKNRIVERTVSGRRMVSLREGGFMVTVKFMPNKTQNDIDLIMDLYESNEGRLISLVGGDDSSVPIDIFGFQKKDMFLLIPSDDLDSAFFNGRFSHGNATQMTLVESI